MERMLRISLVTWQTMGYLMRDHQNRLVSSLRRAVPISHSRLEAMMTRGFAASSVLRLGIFVALMAYLFALRPSAYAAPRQTATSDDVLIHSFAALAQNRPKPCANQDPPSRAPPGWRQLEPSCAWQGLLQMRRWDSIQNIGIEPCLSKQAQWWTWTRRRFASAAPLPDNAWRSTWRSQFLAFDTGSQRHIAIIEPSSGGASWSAIEWTWTPSARPATRAWQQGRWKLLTDLAAARRPARPNGTPAGDSVQLLMAWEGNLNGRAADIDGDAWKWESAGKCLRLLPVHQHEAMLRLPYAREESRLEQRSAMQIQLARRYPDAIWLTPFHLLEPASASTRGGAKYLAVWMDKRTVTGQLWIPTKNASATIQAEVLANLPPAGNTLDGLAASKTTSATIENELIGIGASWDALYER
jgi:hypothetical protein